MKLTKVVCRYRTRRWELWGTARIHTTWNARPRNPILASRKIITTQVCTKPARNLLPNKVTTTVKILNSSTISIKMTLRGTTSPQIPGCSISASTANSPSKMALHRAKTLTGATLGSPLSSFRRGGICGSLSRARPPGIWMSRSRSFSIGYPS